MRIGALLVVGLAASGCVAEKINDPVVCTAIAVSSLNVTVRDAATGTRVCDAAVVATQGPARYELRRTGGPDCGYAGPEERAGLFEVRAARDGYQPAVVTGVRVTEDECHVIPVSVSLDLRPAAP